MVEVEKSEIHHNIINEDAKSRPRSDDDEREDLEEGEIAVADEDTAKTPAAVLHPLENSWTFWFDSQSAKNKAKAKAKQEAKQDSWRTSNPIHTFSEIEVFWSLYNNIHPPSSLTHGADLYCFKHQIEPMWEDPICANGGKWTTSFQKGKSDTAWLYTLLAMIGEQFDYGDEICGAVVNVRSTHEKISIWTKNADNKEAQMSIGKQWKQFLDYSDIIGFIYHEDAKKHDRAAKSRYTA